LADSEQDKSELPTSYRLSQARKKGAVARSMDLGFLTSLAVLLCYLWWTGPQLWDGMAWQMRAALRSAGSLSEGALPLWQLTEQMAWPLVKLMAMLLVAMLVVVGVFEIVQTGIVFSAEPLKPDFTRLNPAQGLKRLFSMRLLIETAKNVFKLAVYSGVAYVLVRGALAQSAYTINDAGSLGNSLVRTGMRLLAAFLAIAFLFAVIDQIISRGQFRKKMRMSRREVRRESRDREGDPRLKQKRKQLHGEFVKTSQSLRNLKGADVLVVNPQHIAIALRYDADRMHAPKVIAIGVNSLAQRMKRIALLYGIPMFEDRLLARALNRTAQLNQEIPENCFAPVADIYNTLRRRQQRSPDNDTDAT
jgi:flagellar biosynthetic protein FlhB